MSKLLVLAFSVLVLTACGSTERPSLTMPDTQVSQDAPRQKLVVRGAVVPDDPEPSLAASHSTPKHKSTIAKADAAASVSAEKAAAAVSAVTEAAASAATGALTATPETAAASPAPVVETVLPTVTADGGIKPKPDTMSTDIPAMIQSVIGGMPIWLMALIAVVLLAAIALGFSGGGRKGGEAA
jgi:hypothetical protein